MSGPGPGGAGEGPEVGSVGEEAARLLDAFADVLGGDDAQRPGAGPRWAGEGLSGLLADAVGTLRDVDSHVATGGQDCRWCPVCRTIHRVREATPEVREHLLGAARSLLAAGSALVEQLEQGAPAGERPAPRDAARPSRVERIDLDAPDPAREQDQPDQSGARGPEEDQR